MGILYFRFKLIFSTSILLILVLFTGCSKQIRFALPEQYIDKANVVGMEQVRDWGDTHSTYFQNDFIESAKQMRKSYPELYSNPNSNIDILALSGGGSKGAYGIGLLKGWHDSGTIPTFRLVTGISTGALVAPFAFLGGKYLDIPADFYTTASDRDVYIKKPFAKLIFGSNSLASSLPLQGILNRIINEELLIKIAEEHKKGRRLFVGTTNLDAKRLVIWNMGHIAELGGQRALEVFRKVLLASASVPVALPPVYFSVKADGKVYDEMHVDGGTTVEVFFYGSILDLGSAFESLEIEDHPNVRLFIIRNSTIQNKYKPVKPRIISIASSALDNLLTNQGIGDLYRIYTISLRDGFDYNLASLPDNYHYDSKSAFDNAEMNMLYDMAYKEAQNGYPWKKYPPFYIK